MNKIAGNTIAKLIIGFVTVLLAAICAGAIFLAAVTDMYGGYTNQTPTEAVNMRLQNYLYYDLDDANAYYQMIQEAKSNTDGARTEYFDRELETYQNRFDPDSTNFRFTIKDKDGNVVLTNIPEGEGADYRTWISQNRTADGTFASMNTDAVVDTTVTDIPSPVPTVTPTPGLKPEETTETETTSEETPSEVSGYTLYGYVRSDMTVDDRYKRTAELSEELLGGESYYIPVAAVSGVAAVVLLFWLLYAAGRRMGTGEITLRAIDRMPWDLYVVLAVGVVALIIAGTVMYYEAYLWERVEVYYGYIVQTALTREGLKEMLLWLCAIAVVVMGVAVMALMSFAARVKVKGWWKNCLAFKFLAWLWRGVKKLGAAIAARGKEKDWVHNNFLVRFVLWIWNTCKRFFRWLGGGLHVGAKKGGKALRAVPVMWRGILAALLLFALEVFLMVMPTYSGWGTVGLLLALVPCAAVLCVFSMIRDLAVASQSIADGDLNYRVNTKGMALDFKTYGENLNRIGEGLSVAVEDRLKSERMKTELITNVSHDLKTPLTSIVNYVDLLKKEELTGTAAEYVEVLDRQSAKLKKLTEDLVEASKASTGNLQVTVETVNVSEFLEQAGAEYSQRLEKAELTVVVQVPEEALLAKSDGRYLWRIMDNLLGNVCKYAMEHTRVYISADRKGEYAVISVKNISRERLNISADELMERFVRGDSSRNTEGSGLGLSIAQSLAALMGGKLELTVDGDLFKAEVYLPAENEEQ